MNRPGASIAILVAVTLYAAGVPRALHLLVEHSGTHAGQVHACGHDHGCAGDPDPVAPDAPEPKGPRGPDHDCSICDMLAMALALPDDSVHALAGFTLLERLLSPERIAVPMRFASSVSQRGPPARA